MKMNNKGQTGGLITGLVFGVASLVIGVIIAFVIVSTLSDAELLTGSRTTSQTVNESDNSGNIAFVNQTGYTLANFDTNTDVSVAVDAVRSVQGGNYNVSVPAANFSVGSTTGIVRNATVTDYDNVSITYTRTIQSVEEQSEQNLRTNFTEGVDNVSDKIPTVLLVAAVVLILGVLAILVGVWQRMRMGGGESL